MKVVFILFDSLNRRSLQPYGAKSIKTPNFNRLAEKSVAFDSHYVGSLPCMPARRDMHTGRLNFLHRSWGPLEPFDNSFPELLHDKGIYSHLISDHYHYWEDGGATYHNRYTSYDFIRGQERDPWKAMVQPPWERLKEKHHARQYSEERRNVFYHHIINREYIRDETEFPSYQCFANAIEFLDENAKADDWLLQIETFDPHEPFFSPDGYRDNHPTSYEGPIRDWPPYARVTEAPEECDELRANYTAIVEMCDAQLGRLLDYFDEHQLWEDTCLIVGTDHGYMLGEHDWWAKNRMPCYDEVARMPLFIYHPEAAEYGGQHRTTLTQTVDLMPTILDLFGAAVPAEVEGSSILPALQDAQYQVRQSALFGVWGSAVNITDGRYTYFRYPPDVLDQELYNYTVMPMHMASLFTPEEMAGASLAPPFEFTKGVPLMKIAGTPKSAMWNNHGPGCLEDTETVLYDLHSDPDQLTPITDEIVEQRLVGELQRLMRANNAPREAFLRFNLEVA